MKPIRLLTFSECCFCDRMISPRNISRACTPRGWSTLTTGYGFLEKGKINFPELRRRIIGSKNFRNSEGKLFHYNTSMGFWEDVTRQSPSIAIRQYVPFECQGLLRAKDTAGITADLLDSIEIHRTFADENSLLINVENGIIDCGKMGRPILVTHNQDSDFRYCSRFNYIEEATLEKAAIFSEFLRSSLGCSSLDGPEVTQVLEMIGYVVSNARTAKKAFVLLGEGNTGKSTLLRFILSAFSGEEVSTVGLHELDKGFRLATLADSRINAVHEVKPVPIKCVDVFKTVVASEEILAEPKNKNPKRVKPRTVIVVAANTMPNFIGMELNNSIANRLNVIRFLGKPEESVLNPELIERLIAEKDIVFSSAIQAFVELRKKNWEFAIPQSTKKYMEACMNSWNSVQCFLEERCQYGTKMRVSARALYTEYSQYCEENQLIPHKSEVFSGVVRGVCSIEYKKIRFEDATLWGYLGIGMTEQKMVPQGNEETDE